MLDTASNHEAIGYRKYMSNTIATIEYNARKVCRFQLTIFVGTAQLTIKGKSGLYANKEPLDTECFKHNFSHLLPILRRIKRRLSENKSMLVRFTSEIGVNRFVPKFLDAFPVFNLTSLEQITYLVTFLILHFFISNIVIHLVVLKLCVFLYELSISIKFF